MDLNDKHLTAAERTRHNLIMAAIRLFAEYGANSVSFREINREAGSRNNSALHHYFGNKIGLLEAVNEFIQQRFDREREEDLKALEEKAKREQVPLREVLEVYMAPYVQIIENEPWGFDGVRTLTRFEFDDDDEVHDLLMISTGDTVNRLQRLVHQSLPNIPKKLLSQRYNFFINAVISGFADHKNLRRSYVGDLSISKLSKLAEIYLDLMEAGLSAPASKR
jgi:AcrR family transcriptional regulator